MVRTALCALLAIAAGVSAASAQSPTDADVTALKELYRRPPARPVENPALVDLGKALFWDPRLSASGKPRAGAATSPASPGPRRRREAATIPAS